jgi:hypothetical protein
MPPITLGPFAIDRTGTLSPRSAECRPALRFAWRGRHCEAAIGGGGVTLAAIAARIPSTAEPGADRERAFAAVAMLPRDLPPGWQLRLTADHRVLVEVAAALRAAPTATSLLTAMVRFALALDPYLDTLEAGGVGAPGRLSNCPG